MALPRRERKRASGAYGARRSSGISSPSSSGITRRSALLYSLAKRRPFDLFPLLIHVDPFLSRSHKVKPFMYGFVGQLCLVARCRLGPLPPSQNSWSDVCFRTNSPKKMCLHRLAGSSCVLNTNKGLSQNRGIPKVRDFLLASLKNHPEKATVNVISPWL